MQFTNIGTTSRSLPVPPTQAATKQLSRKPLPAVPKSGSLNARTYLKGPFENDVTKIIMNKITDCPDILNARRVCKAWKSTVDSGPKIKIIRMIACANLINDFCHYTKKFILDPKYPQAKPYLSIICPSQIEALKQFNQSDTAQLEQRLNEFKDLVTDCFHDSYFRMNQNAKNCTDMIMNEWMPAFPEMAEISERAKSMIKADICIPSVSHTNLQYGAPEKIQLDNDGFHDIDSKTYGIFDPAELDDNAIPFIRVALVSVENFSGSERNSRLKNGTTWMPLESVIGQKEGDTITFQHGNNTLKFTLRQRPYNSGDTLDINGNPLERPFEKMLMISIDNRWELIQSDQANYSCYNRFVPQLQKIRNELAQKFPKSAAELDAVGIG